jgi:hypothetical protein
MQDRGSAGPRAKISVGMRFRFSQKSLGRQLRSRLKHGACGSVAEARRRHWGDAASSSPDAGDA